MVSRRTLITSTAMGAAALATAGVAMADEPKANRVCEILGIEKPVIQASMSGLTNPELVAAVSNAGGLGIIQAVDAETLQAVKALTDKPFAVTSYWFDEAMIATLKEQGVNIIFLLGMGSVDNGYAVDTATIQMLKEQGFIVMFRDVNCTVPAMVAAQEAGADIVIASGYGQGGHMTETRITLASMLAEARPQITVPLVASGCIVDAATASAAAALGAEGAYVGTRFNASVESPCADVTKQTIVDARAEDLVEWRGVLGFVRGNKTPASEAWVAADRAGAARDEMSGMYQGMWAGMLTGDLENWAVGMNDAVNNITSVKTCQEIVDDIASGFLA